VEKLFIQKQAPYRVHELTATMGEGIARRCGTGNGTKPIVEGIGKLKGESMLNIAVQCNHLL
jgi:hypothetical protein